VTTHFNPQAQGWVVRNTTQIGNSFHHSWWYGPKHGWGTTSGPLDYSVEVFRTKREATEALRSVYGRSGGANIEVERVANAVAFELTECERRKTEVLAGDRPDRGSIADANDRSAAYLRGERESR